MFKNYALPVENILKNIYVIFYFTALGKREV